MMVRWRRHNQDVVRADVKAFIVGCLAREQQGPDPEARKCMVNLACTGLRAQRWLPVPTAPRIGRDRVVEGVRVGGTRTGTEAGCIGPPPYLSRLLDRVVGCLVGTACGRRYALACLPLVGRAAGLWVRMLRSSAVCWSMACGPLPVSSRTDGS
jgi:hypothetical protein